MNPSSFQGSYSKAALSCPVRLAVRIEMATVVRRRCRLSRRGQRVSVGIQVTAVVRGVLGEQRRAAKAGPGYPTGEHICKQTPYRAKEAPGAPHLDGKSSRGSTRSASLNESRSQ